MNDLTAIAARAAAEESTAYFVVPLIGSAGSVLKCAYFDANGWRVPAEHPLDTRFTNAIKFVQLPDSLKAHAVSQLGDSALDDSALLFAAVAKTLDKTCALPNTFLATEEGGATSLTIPVGLGTRRGVVLVFRRPATGGAHDLIATTDPEIRNGSSSDD
ncbi:hypothetical protein CS062_22380 [Roseateles chitinivorans]|jgi:hypothetical protein|uniref:Uncharacterized protein n=1 Tax=Roseateles chitinivorans TaxID=2917965 RepID=A0A2G9C3L0_9BURK|nr:hypothetical protein [Roseateles chitinivorans]PIM50955.1 hypothetical protein CS062_22380 [Roseateles chitinivorans]